MLMSLSFALAHVDICDFANDTTPQLTFTCSKVATETLEKGVKYVQINSKNTRTTSYIFASNIRQIHMWVNPFLSNVSF